MKVASNIKCSKAQRLMSPYIDSMAGPEESERLESHLETCKPCQRQLQSYISMRSMIARIDPVCPPEDLILDTRVRLSHARSDQSGGWSGIWSGRWSDRITALLINVLKPVVIPAVSGIALTVLSFSILFGHLALNVRAQNVDSSAMLQQPVRATDQTLLSGGGISENELGEPVSVQANVGANGFVTGITILGGTQSPAVKRWVTDALYPAQFMPATLLGKPVNSTIISVFVNVRS